METQIIEKGVNILVTFEHTEVFNFHGAFRGMRNPKDSWKYSDSKWETDNNGNQIYTLGKKDIELAQTLIKAGSEHRKFMRQIFVCTDITAPRYWWTEFDTYKVGTSANSCSTMHKILSYPFEPQMFEIDDGIEQEDAEFIRLTLRYLELKRIKAKTATNPKEANEQFRRIKQNLPEGFKQKRTVTFTYENVYSMINQRENHRLFEWSRDFVGMAKSLPYSEELIFVRK